MKAAAKLFIPFLSVIGVTLCAQAQGTAFSYQGRLNFNGIPATGLYDLRFTAYAGLLSPSPVGGPVTLPAVPVTNGLFAVTLDFGAGLFIGPQRWLEIAVRTNGADSFVTLDPRQQVTAVPYATHAATASNVVSGSVVKSLNNLRDDVTLTAGANVTLTPVGNSITIAATNVGGTSGPWALNGASAFYNGGNVGIGTTSPGAVLEIRAPDFNIHQRITDSSSGNSLVLQAGSGNNMKVTGYNYGTASAVPLFLSVDGANTVLNSGGGDVGIGTPNPASKLDVRGSLVLDPGVSPTLYTSASSGEQNRFLNLINSPLFQSASGLKAGGLLVSDSYGFADPGKNDLIVKGSVGIGTASLVSALEIDRQDALRIRGFQPFLTMSDTAGFGLIRKANRYLQVVDGDLNFLYKPECNVFPCSQPTESHMSIRFNGNVGIGTTTPQAKLHVVGTIRTSVLTITGGADIAEPFKMSSTAIPKGSVVVIDESNPGHLKLSSEAYDTRVAGVVSGANGVQPGISLHQEGLIEGGENVALSGRVYVQADAKAGAIRPGDLLTTSDTPGHAMKVNDHAKSQGAILGKAMTALAEGKGMVLVLVTLQ